ncbi:MAG: hypothetical protein DMF01_05005 [Verrucomicrobia bacterium]|nr:MAG: hypothetical protein DMF01_05005 [Verrucomicrobiota bacterium]
MEQHWKEYLPLRASPLRDEVADVLWEINGYITAYFRGQLLVCLVDGILIGTALTIFGLNFAPVIGALVVILTQNLEGIFYAPRIVGNYVGLHPMTVIVSIFVWGLIIGGVIGPLLAVPLTATIKVLLARYVWRRRLREHAVELAEVAPVVPEPEIATHS